MSCSARPADFIYEMKGLSESDSRSLLYSAIPAETESNFETECPDMLKMCCGLPLAIIVTSGLLALKSADLGPFGKLEESSLSISDVLNMCFANLSSPVKACFLYLSSFPENYTIKKGRLIWRWVAEGFIPQIGQASMWETGEGYFNELLCRKLIRPVFDDNNDDQAVVCTVHPVIHEFIASLSRQEDFHTTAAELISGPFPYGTIRRFSVDCSRQENNEADTLKSSVIHLSAVRSLTVFWAAGSVPDIGTFKHLRVLDLEDTKSFDDQQAERIKHLFLLRYLGLGGTNITKLPQQIMALKHLATLDLRRTKVRELPSLGNKKLLSLFASLLTIPGGMGGMEELEELSEVLLGRDFQLNLDGSHAKDVAELVSKSRRLRVLGVKFGYLAETEPKGMNHFLKEVGESKLQSLSLDGYPYDSFALLVNYWAPNKRPQKLQKFELRMSGCLPKVPLEMKYIEALTHLHIQVKVVEAQDVRTLGKLPNLILLKLHSEESTQERLSVSRIDDGFPLLKVFWFRSSYWLQFEAGAMPRLQRLKIEFNARKTKIFYRNYDFGLQHLGCLQHVRVIIFCQHAKDPEVKAAEASIRDQVSRNREAKNRYEFYF
jgi:Leucine-rich repeat (LRR) protein